MKWHRKVKELTTVDMQNYMGIVKQENFRQASLLQILLHLTEVNSSSFFQNLSLKIFVLLELKPNTKKTQQKITNI